MKEETTKTLIEQAKDALGKCNCCDIDDSKCNGSSYLHHCLDCKFAGTWRQHKFISGWNGDNCNVCGLPRYSRVHIVFIKSN